MFFLLRTAFWLTLILAVIPLGSKKEPTPSENVDPVSAFLAAQATVSDIGSFCSRNPKACETGGDALNMIGSRARDGAKIVFEYFDTQLAEGGSGDLLVTGSTTVLPTSDFEVQPTVTTDSQAKPRSASTSEVHTGPVPRPKPHLGQKS